MANKQKGRLAGFREIVSGVLVIVFTFLGLASLADRWESNVSKKAVIAEIDPTNNKEIGNKTGRRIV